MKAVRTLSQQACSTALRKGIVCAAVSGVVLLGGCAVRQTHDRAQVSQTLTGKTGHGLAAKSGAAPLPPGVALDALTSDDAVAVALWNNPAFQAELANLGFARADLIDAGLLRNPVLSVLFPLGPKQFEYTLGVPVEALWQRPQRVVIAKLDAEQVAARLVASGLDVAAAAKRAHADAVLAGRRGELTAEGARVAQQISEIAAARLRAGDISENEATLARIAALRAEDEAARAARTREQSLESLRAALGLSLSREPLGLRAEAGDSRKAEALPAPEELLKKAFAARPEVRAAELAMESAGKQLGWETARVIQLAGLVDANSRGREGFETGPGLAGALPIFDWGQGGRARARAAMERATLRYAEARQRIAHEVRDAALESQKAADSLANWRARILPALEESARAAEAAQASGEASYLAVLEARRELLSARVRDAELEADAQRARAQLERSLGKKL